MKTSRPLLAALFCLTLSAGLSQATVLTFDQIRIGGDIVPAISGNGVPADYGDNVTGSPMAAPGGFFTYGNLGEGFTPNVVVEYSTALVPGGVSIWQDSYGDLQNNLFGNQNSGSLLVTLTADPGFDVLLFGFDLAGWPNADYTINAVEIFSGLTPLFSQSNVLVQGDGIGPQNTPFTFGLPLSGQELTIAIDYSNLLGGQQDNIGLDNIRFGQDPPAVVSDIPEPATAWLLLGAAALTVLGKRKRKGLSR